MALVGLLLREQSDLGPCCLQYKIPKYKGRFFSYSLFFRFLVKNLTELIMMCCLFIISIFRILALENIGKNIDDWTHASHDPVMIKIRIKIT